MDTPKQLQDRFEKFPFTWETHPLFPEAAQFLLDCDATEADILKRWNEAIYGDNKPEPKAIEAIITEAWHMRKLRRQMGAAQPTLPSLPSPIAVKRAKRLIDSGAADDALMLLAGAESLQPGDLRLLIQTPTTPTTPTLTTPTTPTTLTTPTTPTTLTPSENLGGAKWSLKWLTPIRMATIAASVIAVVLIVILVIKLIGSGGIASIAATDQTATANANQTATATAQTATANAVAASAQTTTATAKTPTVTPTPPPATVTPTASNPITPTPLVVYLHTLSLTDNTLALPAGFTLPDGVTPSITGKMTIDGVPVEVELKADGSNSPVLTFKLTEEQYTPLQEMFVKQPQLQELPITFTNPNFTINLVAEEQTVQGLPPTDADKKPQWAGYPQSVQNTQTYLFDTLPPNGHAIAVLYADLPLANLVLNAGVYTQVKQNDQIRILATQTVGGVEYYRILHITTNTVGWLPAVFVDGVEEGDATPTVTPTSGG